MLECFELCLTLDPESNTSSLFDDTLLCSELHVRSSSIIVLFPEAFCTLYLHPVSILRTGDILFVPRELPDMYLTLDVFSLGLLSVELFLRWNDDVEDFFRSGDDRSKISNRFLSRDFDADTGLLERDL